MQQSKQRPYSSQPPLNAPQSYFYRQSTSQKILYAFRSSAYTTTFQTPSGIRRRWIFVSCSAFAFYLPIFLYTTYTSSLPAQIPRAGHRILSFSSPSTCQAFSSIHPLQHALRADGRAGVRRTFLYLSQRKPLSPKHLAYFADAQGLSCRKDFVASAPLSNPTSLKKCSQQPDARNWAASYDKFLEKQIALGA